MKLTNITKCPACGGTSLTWDTANRVRNGIQQNRLNSNDVRCIFFLGCDSCSETLAVVSADRVATMLNAEPKCDTCQGNGVIGWTSGQTPEQFDQGEYVCDDCNGAGQAQPQPSGNAGELDERAEFERQFVVQEGVFFSPERQEYRSMNGRAIERTDSCDLSLRFSGWMARAALAKQGGGA